MKNCVRWKSALNAPDDLSSGTLTIFHLVHFSSGEKLLIFHHIHSSTIFHLVELNEYDEKLTINALFHVKDEMNINVPDEKLLMHQMKEYFRPDEWIWCWIWCIFHHIHSGAFFIWWLTIFQCTNVPDEKVLFHLVQQPFLIWNNSILSSSSKTLFYLEQWYSFIWYNGTLHLVQQHIFIWNQISTLQKTLFYLVDSFKKLSINAEGLYIRLI